MSLVELIGLLISLGAFLFIFFGQALKQRGPEKEKQNKKLQDFLDALKKDMEVDEEDEEEEPIRAPVRIQKAETPPPPPPPSRPSVEVSKPMVIQKPLEVVVFNKTRESLIRSKKDLVLMREVMDLPRAYRPWSIRHF